MSKFKAIVSAHIWLDDDGHKDIEILTQVDNDDDIGDIFCDIDHALLDNIDVGDSTDYYFMAIVESEFVRTETLEGVEYDVEHSVSEINSVTDI
ncbi:hypothetical protein J14TS2_44870 [Bacillus sp. J14TS2]|uniref:hypothetical protein n=1 Tax=Bacillus sp. J14TS2 TaxID=2807188 RepID=UPI001B1E0055|nr:hypothetical protein [Bacillus sp. J14TS2]GIN74012.1 hypothetical protein J14TS2_44870 [Bacillus sp. J14TS2]